MSFKKNDLKTGDVVTLRNKEKYFVIKNTTAKDMIVHWDDHERKWIDFDFFRLEDFGENLEYGNIENMSPLDIVLVRRPNTEKQLMHCMCLEDEHSEVVFCGGKVVLSEKSMAQIIDLIEKGYRYTTGSRVCRNNEFEGETWTKDIPELEGNGIWYNLAGLVPGMQGEDGYENIPE